MSSMIYEQKHQQEESPFNRVHSPIVDDADRQDESVKAVINQVLKDYK